MISHLYRFGVKKRKNRGRERGLNGIGPWRRAFGLDRPREGR